MSELSGFYVQVINSYSHPWYPVVCKRGTNIIENDSNNIPYILVQNLQTFDFAFVLLDIYKSPYIEAPSMPDPGRIDK